jgi:hypothetical protein
MSESLAPSSPWSLELRKGGLIFRKVKVAIIFREECERGGSYPEKVLQKLGQEFP